MRPQLENVGYFGESVVVLCVPSSLLFPTRNEKMVAGINIQ